MDLVWLCLRGHLTMKKIRIEGLRLWNPHPYTWTRFLEPNEVIRIDRLLPKSAVALMDMLLHKHNKGAREGIPS